MDLDGLDRITLNPQIMCGQPTMRDTRVTVGTILGLLASGCAAEEILQSYPYLEVEDFRQALSFAAWRLSGEIEIPLNTAWTFW